MSNLKSFASLDAIFGRPRRTVDSHRVLHVERLEDRRLMAADNPLDGGPLDVRAATAVDVPPRCAAIADAGEKFQLRDDVRTCPVQVAPLAAKPKVGRAAAIEQLADAYVFGDVLAPR